MPNWKAFNLARKNVRLPADAEIVAMDCEFVGGADRKDLPARVSIVNAHGDVVCNEFIRPSEPVVDYRTEISGVTEEMLKNAKPIEEIRQMVTAHISGKYLIGHGVENDLKVLGLPGLVPRERIRDTAIYRGLRDKIHASHRTPKLRALVKVHFGKTIHDGNAPHDSIEDAQMALQIYKKFQLQWERNLQKYLDNFEEPNFDSGAPTDDYNDFVCDDFESYFGHLY